MVRHFEQCHEVDKNARYIVPLPLKENVTPLCDSKNQALRRFKTMERSLRSKGAFGDFAEVIREYFEMEHAEQVPRNEVVSPCTAVYYLPMQAVYKKVVLARSVWCLMRPQSRIQEHHSTPTCYRTNSTSSIDRRTSAVPTTPSRTNHGR